MWDRRKADLTPAKVADLRTELKDRLRAQKAAYEEWWARERLRSQRERLEVEAIVRAQREALNEAREMSELERIFGPPGHKGGRNDL